MLLVHSKGGSIADLKAQIDYFRMHYKVFAMDSRDQGRIPTWVVPLSWI